MRLVYTLYNIINDMATIHITRDKSFVGAAMPYRIKIDGREAAKITVGGHIDMDIPTYPFRLDFEMVGNSMNFHPIRATLNIDPRHATSGHLKCHLITKPNWGGIITSGLFMPVGKLNVDFKYQ